MRHIYIRGIISLIWFAAAIVSALSGSLAIAGIYIILGFLFLYSAYRTWKK